MVATAFPDATQAGVEMLQAGGNAIDAACASALALGACEPQASGIGGQTMMLVYDRKSVAAIDGSSRAPSLAHVRALSEPDRSSGYRATTVPSTLATLDYVHRKWGKLPWAKIVEPAIRIATDGYAITDLQSRLQQRELENFLAIPSGSGARYFLNNGKPYQAGDIFKQPELADCLRQIAAEGATTFYNGEMANRIDADMRANGGLLRSDDLAFIPYPMERQPLKGRFRGLRVYSMPLPGAGRTLLFTLNMLNHISAKRLHKDAGRRAVILANVFRKALLERSDRPVEPNFYPQTDQKHMLSSRYAGARMRKIAARIDPKLPILETVDETRGETTHLSVMDKNGLAVSLTQSIERVYGSKAAADGLGFLYNNYMMDFDYSTPAHPFYLRPNAVPWATVAPTLLFHKNRIWMALGSPGSERIMSTLTQFLMHMLDEGKPMHEALHAPRLHCSLGGRIDLEADRFDASVIEALEKQGFRIKERETFAFYLGAVHAVLRKTDGSGFQGAAEVRRDGTAAGLE